MPTLLFNVLETKGIQSTVIKQKVFYWYCSLCSTSGTGTGVLSENLVLAMELT